MCCRSGSCGDVRPRFSNVPALFADECCAGRIADPLRREDWRIAPVGTRKSQILVAWASPGTRLPPTIWSKVLWQALADNSIGKTMDVCSATT
jgi:hypothetical protein